MHGLWTKTRSRGHQGNKMGKLNSMKMEQTQRSAKISDLAIFPSPGRQIHIFNNSVHVPNHMMAASKHGKSEQGGDLSQMGNYLG